MTRRNKYMPGHNRLLTIDSGDSFALVKEVQAGTH